VQGGAFIEPSLKNDSRVGQELELIIPFALKQEHLKIRAKVAWANPNGIGVRFIAPIYHSNKELSSPNHFLRACLKTPSKVPNCVKKCRKILCDIYYAHALLSGLIQSFQTGSYKTGQEFG
jgi:hypothetical protein